MPIKGRKRPNLASANAHVSVEENDWVPAPITYAGSGEPVPAELLPVQHLTEPLELIAGGFFVPDVDGSAHGNDTPGRANARKADTIEVGEIKRAEVVENAIAPEPVGAESGVVERPGKAKARTA